jgi:hypothetical protein
VRLNNDYRHVNEGHETDLDYNPFMLEQNIPWIILTRGTSTFTAFINKLPSRRNRVESAETRKNKQNERDG